MRGEGAALCDEVTVGGVACAPYEYKILGEEALLVCVVPHSQDFASVSAPDLDGAAAVDADLVVLGTSVGTYTYDPLLTPVVLGIAPRHLPFHTTGEITLVGKRLPDLGETVPHKLFFVRELDHPGT